MGKLLPVPYPGQSMDEYRELLINFQKNYWSFLKPYKGGSKFIPLPPLTLIKKTKEMSSRKLSEHVEDELFNKEKRVTVDPKKVIKTTPKIVRRCYRNWKNIGKVKDLRILTPENLSNFIPQSEIDRINYACQGNLAVKSDFIGLFILHRYGGTMIDGTVYMHSPLSSWLPKAIGNASFFCFEGKRYSKGGICPETFFMYSKPGSLLAKEWYSRIHQVGASQDIDRFINRLEQKYL